MITWLPALLRIVGRIINGIMNVNAIKECRLLCEDGAISKPEINTPGTNE